MNLLTVKLLSEGHLQNAKVPHTADLEHILSAYNSLITGSKGFGCDRKLSEIMVCLSF